MRIAGFLVLRISAFVLLIYRVIFSTVCSAGSVRQYFLE